MAELPKGFTLDNPLNGLPEGFVLDQPIVNVEAELEDDKGVFQDVGQGIGAGIVNIGQGVTELGAAGIDLAFDTSSSREVTEFFEGVKEYLNLTPTGTAGKVAEGIVTFGSAAIPIVGWLGRANAVAKGAKIVPGTSKFAKSAEAFGKSAAGKKALGNKLKLAASTSLATGAADVFLAPSTFNTVSDGFDALPDVLKTEKDTGLIGSEEGARRFRNKFRIGVEGVVAGAAFEAAFPVLGAVARAPAYVPGVPKVARLINGGFDALANQLSGTKLQKYFTSTGLVPKEIYEGVEDVKGVTSATTRDAAKNFLAFEKAAKKTVKASKLFGKGKEGIDKAYSDLHSFLIGRPGIDEKYLAKEHSSQVATAAVKMRDQITGLTDIYMKSVEDVPDSILSVDAKKALIEQFASNQNKYLRRMYEAHLSPEKFIGKKRDEKLYATAIKEVAGILQKPGGSVGDELIAEAKRKVDNVLRNRVTDGGDSISATLDDLAQGLQKRNKGSNGQPVPMFKIATGMLKPRVAAMESPALRDLMGEIKDPKKLYLHTVGDMSQTLAANQFYRQYADTSMSSLDDAVKQISAGGKPLAIDGRTVDQGLDPSQSGKQGQRLRELGYEKLGDFPDLNKLDKMTNAEKAFGETYGALTGSYVPSEIKDALTIASRSQDPLQEMLAVSLQAKGLSQMTKTVLNPLSHIRNFHSGLFMLGANGNVSRGMNMFESARLTMGKLADMNDAEFAKTFNTLQKAGIVDQNYVVNEFKALLKEGADLKVAGKVSSLSSGLMKRIPFAHALNKGAQGLYSGTDNFWKTVGFTGEKAKFANAIRRGVDGTTATMDDIAEEFSRAGLVSRTRELTKDMDFLDLMSADIVKSTMPTYSRVPEAIKMIRRVPIVGNFVAFPAEIMRTTTNITRQGVKELGYKVDPNSALFTKLGPAKVKEFERQVRAIGAKRLSNYIAMAYMAPIGMQKAAMELTDFTEDQMAALERLAPYFTKGNILAPIRSETVNGKPKVDYVDLSYMMPYDFMIAPARAAMQAYSETGEVSDSQLAQIGNSMQAAVLKLTEPFASESLMAERIADVAVRNGETKTGASIFVEGENQIDRATKGALHILGGFTPGAFEMFYRERRGELEPGRVSKALSKEPGRYGEEFTAAEEAASLVTGFREMQTDLDKNFYYKGAEYTGARSSLRSSFTSFAKRNDVSADDIVKRYKQVNQDLLSSQASLYADVQAARTLGLSENDIIRQLSDKAKLGREEIGLLLDGTFRPISITKDLVRDILMESIDGQARVTTDLPVDELINQFTSYQNIKLVPQERVVEEESTLLPEGFVLDQTVDTEGFTPQVETTTDSFTGNVIEKSSDFLERAKTFVPSLLGDRANQEIADRARDNQ